MEDKKVPIVPDPDTVNPALIPTMPAPVPIPMPQPDAKQLTERKNVRRKTEK